MVAIHRDNLPDLVSKAAEKLGITCYGVICRAAIGDPSRDVRIALLAREVEEEILPWVEEFCVEILK